METSQVLLPLHILRGDEPALTTRYHPKPIAYVRVHSWWCIFYRFGQVYNDMYLLQYHTKFYWRKILCAPTVHPCLLPQPTTDLFTVPIVFSFLECHIVEIVGIIQYVAFSDWLLSLSNIHLSFLCVFSWCVSSFFSLKP